MTKIFYLDGPCGARKTTVLMDRAAELQKFGGYVLFISKSINLTDQTFINFTSKHPTCVARKFHSETDPTGCVKPIMAELNSPHPDGIVLFITFQAFQIISVDESPVTWLPIIDEVFDITNEISLDLTDNHSLITDHLIEEAVGPKYSCLSSENDDQINKLSRNKNKDMISDVLQEAAQKIRSPHWTVRVITAQYRRLLTNTAAGRHKLQLFSFLEPTIFDGYAPPIVAGAWFTTTGLLKSWSEKGVEFVEDEALAKKLLYTEHENCEHITIHYLMDVRWSKWERNKGDTFQKVVDKTKEIFGDNSFLYAMNKDVEDKRPWFDGCDATAIPSSPHGLNCFDKYHRIAILSALNPSPAHVAYLKEVGEMDPDSILQAIHQHGIYQIAGRIGLRNPGDKSEMTIVIPDLLTATFLNNIFKGSKLVHSPIEVTGEKAKNRGRPPKHKNSTVKVSEFRKSEKEKLLNQVESLIDPAYIHESGSSSCNDNTILYSNAVTPMCVSLWTDVKKTIPYSTKTITSLDKLDEWLEKVSQRSISSKTKAGLWSAATFTGTRSAENLDKIYAILLDVDDGDLKPNELAELFPTVRMTFYATYKSTREQPRYRVVIPLSQPISHDVYALFRKQILQIVKENGFPLVKRKNGTVRRAHGIDPKCGAAGFVYLPAEPADKSAAMFQVVKEGREPLNVITWIEQTTVTMEAPCLAPAVFSDGVDEETVKVATEQWAKDGGVKGFSNGAFSDLAVKLASAGVKGGRLRTTLATAALTASTPRHRNQEVRNLARWVEKNIRPRQRSRSTWRTTSPELVE